MKKQVLIVEDDYYTQDMYKFFFEMFMTEINLELTQCISIEEVLSQIGQKEFDLYLLDGQIIRGHTSDIIEQLPAEKVIVISADMEYEKMVKKLNIIFFFKPFTTIDLKDKKELIVKILNK